MFRHFWIFLLSLMLGLDWAATASTPASREGGAPELLLIFDASGSMWGQISGENKIVIARRVLKSLVGSLPDEAQVGLVAYGHRREGDCEDIETLMPLAPLDREGLIRTVEGINPKGKTPITKALKEAFASLEGREKTCTVILISDGLETCNADPCQAVRAAKKGGSPFVLHVVGFDVGEGDVSQLECAAQAGEGAYYSAANADELAAALDRAAAAPVEVPPGRLSIKALADGELVDVAVRIRKVGESKDTTGGRTYKSPETNPRLFPLEDGAYDVLIKAVGFKGETEREFKGLVIADGGMVEKVVDFSSGSISIKVTRNGELSDATVRIYPAGETRAAASGRTYTRSNHNPANYQLTVGTYDIEIKSVEISSNPTYRWEGVEIASGQPVEKEHNFVSGAMAIGAVAGGALVDATVQVLSMETNKQVAAGRTYTGEKTNPRRFVLSPGIYKVKVGAVKLKDNPRQEFELEVQAGQTVERTVTFEE